MYTYEYPKVDHAVDIVILRLVRVPNDLPIVQVALIQRLHEPFQGCWAFPGGYLDVDRDKSLEDAAYREACEEVGVIPAVLGHLEQFRTYSDKDRDPRGWVIGTAFIAVIPENVELQAGDDAKTVVWHDLAQLPELAFDHERIVGEIIIRLGETKCAGYAMQPYVERRLQTERGAI